MKYFKQDDNKRLTWSVKLFNDAKEGAASNANGINKDLCHLEKKTFEHEVVMMDWRLKKRV